MDVSALRGGDSHELADQGCHQPGPSGDADTIMATNTTAMMLNPAKLLTNDEKMNRRIAAEQAADRRRRLVDLELWSA